MKVCVVVGAGPGLGGSVAYKFSKLGFTSVLLNRSQESAQPTLDRIEQENGKAVFISTDVSDVESVKKSFDQIHQQVGPVDVLVYNPGGGFYKETLVDMKIENMMKTFTVNAFGFIKCCQQVLPSMIERQQGTILATSATSAFRASPGLGAFSASKFALRALCQALAKENAKFGIHCVHIRIDCLIDSERSRQMMGGANPEKFGWPDDIADTYVAMHNQSKHGWSNEIDIRPYTEDWSC